MIDMPFERNLMISVAFISLVIALMTFVFLILNRIWRIFKRIAAKRVDYISINQTVYRFVLTILWITPVMNKLN